MERVGQWADPDVDPGIEGQLGFAAQVLDCPLQLAGIALGYELGRELHVDHDDC